VYRRFILLTFGLLLIGGTVLAQESTPTALSWDSALNATWEGYKERFIFCGEPCGNNVGLVFDPSAGYTAVSEGIGYGMLMAVLANDQATFDIIYTAANDVMLNESRGLYHWQANPQGRVTGRGAALDADEDIALALIFAHQRIDAGEWQAGENYGERASALIDAIYDRLVSNQGFLLVGDNWGINGEVITNPSYFAPAWYRRFDEFQGTERWGEVIENLYTTLYASEGAPLGLAPDWSQADGQPAFPYCDGNNRARESCRYEMMWESIRTPYRIGMDCLWYSEERACEWSQRGAAFLLDSADGDAAQAAIRASMFDMSGNIVNSQNEGMVGMWLVGARASQETSLFDALSTLLLDNYGQYTDQGFWGNYEGAAQYYYNQSLAWIGASVAAGWWDEFIQ
jgi:endo-1,4-beta-D-glucanase Y